MITRSIVAGLVALGLAAMALPAGAQMVVGPNGPYAYELWGPYQFGPGLRALRQGTPLTPSYLRPLTTAPYYTPGPFYAPGGMAPGLLTPSYLDRSYFRGRVGIQLLPHRGTLRLSQVLWGRPHGY
jgi:hypothetical protein